MSKQEQPDLVELRRVWRDFAKQMNAAFQRIAEAARPLAEFAQSPEGQALIAARPSEPLEYCHCLCGF